MASLKRKLVLLGDGAVGKTSLIDKFVYNRFDDRYVATIGTKVSKKDITVDKHDLCFVIWDVLGQEGYSAVQESSLVGSQGAFLVADVTRKETLVNLTEYWIPRLPDEDPPVRLIFLANKADLVSQAQFGEKELGALAREYRAPFFMTSARTGENVEGAFRLMGINLLDLPLETQEKKEFAPRAKAIKTPIDVADIIIQEFCAEHGDWELCMAIIRKQFDEVGMDVKEPTREGLRRVIDQLEAVETGWKGVETAKRLKRTRDKLLRAISPQNDIYRAGPKAKIQAEMKRS